MEEIEIGSEWIAPRYASMTKVVVHALIKDAQGASRVVIENVWRDGPSTFTAPQRSGFLRDHEPIPPSSKKGAQYRLKNHSLAGLRYDVTEIQELDGKQYAIAVRVNYGVGERLVILDNFAYYERV